MIKQYGNTSIKLTLLVFFCLFVPEVYSRSGKSDPYFYKLNITNGLSQNTVNVIMQDRTGFMWFGTKDGLNRYDGQTFRIYKRDSHLPNSIGNNLITALLEDKKGNIWVGTDAGLYIYYPEKDIFEQVPFVWPDGAKIDKTITLLFKDHLERVWISSETQGLLCYDIEMDTYDVFASPQMRNGIRTVMVDPSGMIWVSFYPGGLYYSTDGLKTLTPFTDAAGEEIFKYEIISKIHPGIFNRLYLGSEKEGLKELNLSTGTVRRLPLSEKEDELIFVRDILPYSDEELWIGTESGIFIYNIVTGTSKHLKSTLFDPYSLSDNAVYCFCKDREDGVWVGTYFGGINYLPKTTTPFNKFYPTGKSTDLQGRRVREICKAQDDGLWIGTEDHGLYYFDPRKRKFQFFTPSEEFTNVHALCMVDDDLWVGTFSQGIKVINKDRKIVKTFVCDGVENCLADNRVFTICRTKEGEIYLGTLFGLQRYRPETDDFYRIPDLEGVFIYDIKEDASGDLWLATYIYGLYRYIKAEDRWEHFMHNPADKGSIPSNKVLSVFEDHSKTIWITTQGGGVSRYNPAANNFQTYNTDNGFPDDVVYQIIEDPQHFLWMTTNTGLVKFDPKDISTQVFTVADGLLSNQFNYKSGYISPSGTIYFGSIEGLISFDIEDFEENTFVPPIVITDFLLFNEPVRVGEKGSPLNKNIPYLDKLTLTSKQNSFSFRIAALSYQAPSMNELIYKLEGFDRDWHEVNVSPLITYSNLRHGKYTFRIKGSNSHGVWNGKETWLTIHILPPFYLTYGAYFVYLLIVSGIIYQIVLYSRNRAKAKEERMIELFNQEKEREIHNSKIEFFTNVAHEIRTPLTLINGPLDNILSNKNLPGDMLVDLNIMSKNTSRLMDLVNQLLDFRKTEIQGFSINYMEYNISEILKETFVRFIPLVKQQKKEFEVDLPETDLYAHVDKEAFTKIISNLFNNAVKYADHRIHLSLQLPDEENEYFEIIIENDGLQVPEAMREEIFKPFVRLSEDGNEQTPVGTGIGLALARSLAELHSGCLFMEEDTALNRFVLRLPVTHEETIRLSNAVEPKLPEELIQEFESSPEEEGRPTILIVEDHLEMQSFIARQFASAYNVYTASNGLEALKVLDSKYINIVVCDILMPVMNGYEFCRKIKSDITYSHIPVILLTAKTNIQSKIEGMEAGADAYIEKPFATTYLQACVTNLLQSRTNLKDAFTQSPHVKVSSIASNRQDEEFLIKLNEMIDENIKNPNFSIDDMAETFYMSRSSFYRKIKGTVGMSPNEYLRLERLKKAARLLKEEGVFVNEVCYMVGFNSPSYFTKCFYKQFGVLPKEYN